MSKKLVSPDTISGNTVCLIQKADSIYQPKSKSKRFYRKLYSYWEKWEVNYQKNSTTWNESRFCWTEKQHLRKYDKGLTPENLYLPEIEKDKLLRFSCSRFFLYFVDCPALHFVHQIFVSCQAEEEKLTSIVKNFAENLKICRRIAFLIKTMAVYFLICM